MARAMSVHQEEPQPGLLSRAFAPGSSFARAVSLHNLLDVQHLDTLPESVRPLPECLQHPGSCHGTFGGPPTALQDHPCASVYPRGGLPSAGA